MSLTLRRTRADDSERDAELSQTIDIGALHALLHAHGEADLAAALLLRLTHEGARDLAALLARFRRRHSKPGLFRSYTRLLDADGARRVDLAVAFLRGAGYAGCRVYPDPQADDDDASAEPVRPRPLYPLPRDGESARDPEGDGGGHSRIRRDGTRALAAGHHAPVAPPAARLLVGPIGRRPPPTHATGGRVHGHRARPAYPHPTRARSTKEDILGQPQRQRRRTPFFPGRERLMGAIPTEPEQRRAYFAALGRTGGAATLERYGASHFAALGKQGFATTLGRYGGDFVWRLLRDSYLRKYPDRTEPRCRSTDEAREKDRLRAEARRLYPDPRPCADCGAPATQRDHVRGVRAGNAPDNVAWRCDRCHTAKTRAERDARWGSKDTAKKEDAA